MRIEEYLHEVRLKDRRTGEEINVKIWANNKTAATHKLSDSLLGAYGPYVWAGTEPVYVKNERVIRVREV